MDPGHQLTPLFMPAVAAGWFLPKCSPGRLFHTRGANQTPPSDFWGQQEETFAHMSPEEYKEKTAIVSPTFQCGMGSGTSLTSQVKRYVEDLSWALAHFANRQKEEFHTLNHSVHRDLPVMDWTELQEYPHFFYCSPLKEIRKHSMDRVEL